MISKEKFVVFFLLIMFIVMLFLVVQVNAQTPNKFSYYNALSHLTVAGREILVRAGYTLPFK